MPSPRFRISYKKWFYNIILGFDQWVNTWFMGDPDETISSRLGKIQRRQQGAKTCVYYLCKFLSLFDKRHCELAIEEDEGKDAILPSKEKPNQ